MRRSAASRTLYFLRHLAAILILPFTVVVLVPIWIARRYGVRVIVPDDVLAFAALAAGALVLITGGVLFVASLRRFGTEGDGTLAPWDPPRHLVVRGPYRYVRNPMISGVILMLFGIALLLRSLPHTVWAIVALAINATYIPLLEEPLLERRFGDEYRQYCRHVPRLLPRARPWRPPGKDAAAQ